MEKVNVYTRNEIEVKKPTVIKSYNAHMGGGVLIELINSCTACNVLGSPTKGTLKLPFVLYSRWY